MRSIGQLTCQILPRKVQLLVQIRTPFGAIGHIIDDAVIGDQFPCAALAGAALQLYVCDDAVRDVHPQNYTGYGRVSKKNLLPAQEIFDIAFNLALV